MQKQKSQEKLSSCKNENGFVFLSLILAIILIFISFFCLLKLGQMIQFREALVARLDICSTKIVTSRVSLFKKISLINQNMEALAIAVYTMRGVKLIGGPIVAVGGSLSEEAALKILRSLKASENALISRSSLLEPTFFLCANTPYSSIPAFCKFAAVTKSSFSDKKSLFPDVPRGVYWNSAKLLQTNCSSSINSNIQTKQFISGDKQLLAPNHTYAYTNQKQFRLLPN